jgi:hypothetical protein
MNKKIFSFWIIVVLSACSKNTTTQSPPVTPPVTPASFSLSSLSVNGVTSQMAYYGVNVAPAIVCKFSRAINRNTVSASITLKANAGNAVNYTIVYDNDSALLITPALPFSFLTKYILSISADLKSVAGGSLNTSTQISLLTVMDSSDKFPRISDNALLDLVQQQTLKYFTDFAHPISGMARERNSSGDVVTTGGTGFGVMGIISGVSRNFISRANGLALVTKVVNFLKNNCSSYHGAFSHWINGSSGATVPFSAKDDGADIVETSYLLEGLLCARQFFNGADAAESDLRTNINFLWNRVEWNWFRQNSQDVLYWHWSPNYAWDMNFQVKGWNEAMIVYALAASSNTDSIPRVVYDNGWAGNGSIKNGNAYYGYTLPLGPALGGPLFFSHYSFLGINPKNLTDNYADYNMQTINHSKINYAYCVNNPKSWYGYSSSCWGLTASDEQNGYSAHAPDNDNGTITPTAAISSLPYTPAESISALKFFYYTLGDKIWKQYGFADAFNLTDTWFADSFLAIDQGPEIVMIENYRTGLLWNLFMSCPEVKRGMKQLGFQSPDL